MSSLRDEDTQTLRDFYQLLYTTKLKRLPY